MEVASKSKDITKVYGFFIAYLIIFALNLAVPTTGSYTTRMWFFSQLFIMVLAMYTLIKEGLPKGRVIAIALFLGVLAGLLNPMAGIWTVVTFMASSRIFDRYNNRIPIFKSNSLKDITISIGLALFIGTILGYINLLLSNQPLNFQIKFINFLHSLNPGIFEEVSFRLFMYAFCLYLLQGQVDSKKTRLWCYVLMTIPHVMVHLPDTLLSYGIVSFIISTVIFTVLYGIPLSLLQRKRDLASAMIVHGLIDFIRFSFLGFPF